MAEENSGSSSEIIVDAEGLIKQGQSAVKGHIENKVVDASSPEFKELHKAYKQGKSIEKKIEKFNKIKDSIDKRPQQNSDLSLF